MFYINRDKEDQYYCYCYIDDNFDVFDVIIING